MNDVNATEARAARWRPASVGRALAIAGGCAAAILFGAAALALYALYSLPLPAGFAEPGRPAMILTDEAGASFAARGISGGRPVAVEALPRHLVDAVLVMEDRRFFEHEGIDWRGILRAAAANLRAGEIREGGSTITQQLAKMQFLTPERSFRRKLREALLALWLERRLEKREILARYLGAVYLGAGAYGVEAAARRYFGKPPAALSLAEAAMLAGLIQAPSRDAPTRAPAAAEARAALVLAAMLEAGLIDRAAAEEARARPARLAVAPDEGPGRGYFADWAEGEARRLLGGLEGDFVVETTLDPKLQELAERTLAELLDGEGAANGVSQGAIVALSLDGAVRAMVGGRSYGESQFNRAAQARRQPGSLFKLFVYLAALDSGLTPDSPVLDAPVTVDGWTPRNYGDRHVGETTLRTAFAQSLNSATVRLAEQVGRRRIIEIAAGLGIASPLYPDPSLALGTGEVTLLEITAAYAAVAAGADRLEPFAVRGIRGPGAILYRRPERAAERPAWPRKAMLELLREAVRSGTARAAALEVPVFGKTGTTQDHRDAWFVGFTADLVVGVWLGNDDGAPTKGVTGGTLPARLAAAILEAGREGAALAATAAEAGRPEPVAVREAAPEGGVPGRIEGVPAVLDTATLLVGGRRVRLAGVVGEGGAHARAMADYIAGREVACLWQIADLYRCEVEGWDLAEVVLFNGGGRAGPGADATLVAAERQAQAARIGRWAGE